ncbi:MAG: hypothetical protein HZB26_05825 [Candidatus Hydrogenedentes bacterium]|nr:hypothetical protein [Candidatus Hydrogenedentota bacterium]
MEQFAELSKDFDSQLAQRIALESMLIRLSKVSVEFSLDSVLEKLVALGQGGLGASSGVVAAPARDLSSSVRQRSEAPKAAVVSAAPGASGADTPAAAPRKRKPATEKNMAGLWQQVKGIISQGGVNLNLGLNADRAKPAAIEGDTLVLRIPSDQSKARSFLEKPEQRAAIEAALAELTDNVRTFRCEAGAGAEPEEAGPAQSTLPISGRVDPNAARAALDDPHVAQVVDVFKGRIVDIKSESKVSRSE